MIELIKKGAKLSKENRPLLLSEVVLFSISIWLGVPFMVGLVVCCIGPGMADHQVKWHVLYDFCDKRSMGFYAVLLGFAGGGWPWAFIVGGTAFWMGIKVHVNGLKWHWDEIVYKSDDSIEWKRINRSGPNASREILN